MKLIIKNYQLISDASLEFVKGLNVIVGPSNNSKSSIYRAFYTVCFNPSNRESHIQFGKSVMLIGVDYNNNKIVYKRDKNQSSQVSYKINDILLQKVGRGPVTEIMDAINIHEISVDDEKYIPNFSKQMSYPFLMDKSSNQLFKFFIGSNNKQNLLQVHSSMKDDLQELKKNFDISEALREQIQQQQITTKKYISGIIQSFIRESSKSEEELRGEYRQYLSNLIDKIQSEYLPLSYDHGCIKDNINNLININTKLNNINIDQLKTVYKQYAIIKTLNPNKLKETQENITLLKTLINKLKTINIRIKNINKCF